MHRVREIRLSGVLFIAPGHLPRYTRAVASLLS
ncbi:MAG: hypothetical protein J07HQW2_00634, partial [Haloquadratum walsbyi J07HQW2]